MQRRLAAILAADVVGYSKLMAADEVSTLEALRAHRAEIFDPAIARHKGRIFKLMGDGTLVEFSSVVDAVEAAIAIQTAIAENPGVITLRIGINLGDVIIEGDDIYGDGVNVAARLEALAEPGGVAIASIVKESLGNRSEARFTDIGIHTVKNIDRPIQVFQWSGTTQSAAKPTAEIINPPSPDKPSIAVLAFDNMSGDPEQEYFSDGISEDIITALSSIRWLMVIARNSTFAFKGKATDVKQIGETLGARYVVEGSVRKAGNRVRVTTQLIDANSGGHVWANRYDRELEDIFALQDEITETIVGSIDVELRGAEQQRARHKPTNNMKAWDLYQRGNWHVDKITKSDNAAARRYFEQAAELDPEFALAYTGQALVGISDVLSGYTDNPEQTVQNAKQSADVARDLDDREAMTSFALGRVHGFLGNSDVAISNMENAVRLNPSFAMAHHGLGFVLKAAGRAEEALPHLAMAIKLSPHDPLLWTFYVNNASAYLQLRKYAEAEHWARKAIGEKEKNYWPHFFLAIALIRQNKTDEANISANRGLELKPDFSIAALPKMLLGYQKDYVDRTIESLRDLGLPE